MIEERLARKVKIWLEKTNTTQTALAKQLGVSKQHLSSILNLKDSNLRIEEELEEMISDYEKRYFYKLND